VIRAVGAHCMIAVRWKPERIGGTPRASSLGKFCERERTTT
jgi:hypothetical protein